jgi:hypothetical protein
MVNKEIDTVIYLPGSVALIIAPNKRQSARLTYELTKPVVTTMP